jgi:DNA-binding transcriptional regulator YhcF (GntR family)|tara:strand:- start:2327 stop:2500 length:174 start_codon:yes stop_codon:yes gene_type:complete
MDTHEKTIRLEALEMTLEDLNKIIDSMTKNSYSKEQINEYVKMRWQTWNEIDQVRKA